MWLTVPSTSTLAIVAPLCYTNEGSNYNPLHLGSCSCTEYTSGKQQQKSRLKHQVTRLLFRWNRGGRSKRWRWIKTRKEKPQGYNMIHAFMLQIMHSRNTAVLWLLWWRISSEWCITIPVLRHVRNCQGRLLVPSWRESGIQGDDATLDASILTTWMW